MFRFLRNKKVSVMVLLFLVGGGLSVAVFPAMKAQALSGSDFQAGYIISDANFTNNSSMSEAEIQNFLNSKVPSCDTNGAISKSYYYNSSSGEVESYSFSGASYVTTSRATYGQRYDSYHSTSKAAAPYVCLKNYVENPSTHQNNLQNPNASISGGQSAAQIIYNAAQTYNINPQVLLVTLQKEEGLVTDDWPWTNEYQIAMGYACPDGASCDSQYYGFANQVSNAAAQFRRYLTNPNHYNYVVGTNQIEYHYPQCMDSSGNSISCSSVGSTSGAVNCGTDTVNIINQATAALYDYTPYTPNAAALSSVSSTNSGGTGDRCSAYGNRNFWWYFNTWFGSSTGPAYSWSVVDQPAYSDSARQHVLSQPVNMVAGSTIYVTIHAKNTGSVTWYNWGSNAVDLGTYGRTSAFCTTGWMGCDRPARLQEDSVAPGQTGTFMFAMQAPSKAGDYREYFNIVSENKAWFNDIGQYFDINVQAAKYSWSNSQQTYWDAARTKPIGWNATFATGQTIYATIRATNTGNVTWYNWGSNAVDLGTYGRTSAFCTTGWMGCDRPARMLEDSVAPGQTATFEFALKAPSSPGDYHEYFNIVSENKAWFNDIGQYFDLNVQSANYSWKPGTQAVYTDSSKQTYLGWNATLSPGQHAYAVVNATNTSNFVWTAGGNNPIRLGTYGRTSAFCTTGWVDCDRAAELSTTVYPGQTATFEFPIVAPSTKKTYQEYFNLIQENRAWFISPGQYFLFTVQ